MSRMISAARAVAALAIGLAAPMSLVAQPAGVPGISVRMIDLPSGVDNQVQANDILNNGYANIVSGLKNFEASVTDVTRIVPFVNFIGNAAGDADSVFESSAIGFPGLQPGGQPGGIFHTSDHLVAQFNANVSIPAGTYQFGVGSDDGFTVTIPGVQFFNTENTNGTPADVGKGDDTFIFNAGRGVEWTLASFTVPAGGLNTTISGTWHEGTGGAAITWAIRDASQFDVTRSATDPDINVELDEWQVFQDGVLGWQVRTDAMQTTYFGGQGVADKQFLKPTLINPEFGPTEDLVGSINFAIYDNNDHQGNGNWDSLDDIHQSGASFAPTYQGVMAAPLSYFNNNYPDDWQAFFPDNVNQEQYSAKFFGEIFVPEAITEFKDGNDDYTLLRIDLNGDGDLTDANEVIINDNAWTNQNATANNGSPVSPAEFENLPAGGAWRKFEFWLGEGGGGDGASLFWSSGDAGFLPLQGQPTGPEYLVAAENLRVAGHQPLLSTDLGLDFSGQLAVFDVDVEELEWDKVAISSGAQALPTGSEGATIGETIVSFENGIIRVELSGDPTPGLTIDLVDNTGLDQIVGPASFQFSHGDESLWDISQFAVNGQLTYGSAQQGIVGDYNGNGRVEQADLDLVLLNWGQALAQPWVEGTVDQAELDGVLLNWGNEAALGSAAGVPEPSTVALILVAAGLGFGLIRRR